MSPKFDIITLDEIISMHHQERFPDLNVNHFFEIFVSEQILKERDLSDEELLDGNPGGPLDGGIDGVHLFVNGVRIDETNINDYLNLKENIKIDFHLMQAKNKNRMEQEVINKFSAMADDLFDTTTTINSFSHAYNSGVIQAFSLFRQLYSELGYTAPEINIIFSYATKGGSATKNMRRKAEQLQKKIGNFIPGCNCKFDFLGATELLNLSRMSPSQIFKLRIAEGPLSSDEEGKSFIALIRLDRYFEFISNAQGELNARLFEANVRDWQGDNKVNSQIQNTLQDKGTNDFWWLNNGVTILAKSATQTGRIFHLENPEIVNGLQTSRTIYNHFAKINCPVDERKLLTRIIVISDETEDRESIIRATNSQTAVGMESLRSLDRIHRNIETYFTSQQTPLYYDRRKNQYKNQRKPAKSIIGIKQLTQAVLAAALFRPDDAKGRPGKYLKASDDQEYLSVYDENNHPALYYFCASLYKAVEDVLKQEEIDNQFDMPQRRSVRFHIMTHVILRHLNIARSKISSSISLVSKQNINEIDDTLIAQSANHVLHLLDQFQLQNPSSRIKWKEFESFFFKDLDNLLSQPNSK